MNIEYITVKEINDFIDSKKDNKNPNLDASKINISNIILVRTMDNFPNDGIINSKRKDLVLEELDEFVMPYYYALRKLGIPLNEQMSLKYFSGRSTIHFCINGLVSNHVFSNFSNRKLFSFDKLENHLSDKILSIRPEDTYFQDEFEFSNEAFMGMSKKTYEGLSEEKKYELNNLKKLYVFDENIFDLIRLDKDEGYNNYLIENELVSYMLEKMGYPSFKIGEHNYQNYQNIKEQKMLQLLEDIRNNYNISAEKHFYSQVHKDDDVVEIENQNQSVKEHFNFLLDNFNSQDQTDDELKTKLFKLSNIISPTFNPPYYEELLITFLKRLGIDNYIKLTQKYNDNLEQQRKNFLIEQINANKR